MIVPSCTLDTAQRQGLLLIVQSPPIGLLETAFDFHFVWEEKEEAEGKSNFRPLPTFPALTPSSTWERQTTEEEH